MKHIICNKCGCPIRWDEISTGDECPDCHTYIKGKPNTTSYPAWEGHYRQYIRNIAGCATRDTSTPKQFVQYMVFCYNTIIKKG